MRRNEGGLIEVEKRNIVIMWIACFFVGASMTMILPFLSLYIDSFGHYEPEEVQRFAGWVFGISFFVAFLVSPLWGRIGDRYGRKKILIGTGFGIAISVFFMGHVESVGSLFILRLFMGLATGFIPASMALIAAQSDKRIAGQTLGTLMTGQVSGGLLGPLFGGLIADAVGMQYTFVLTSSVLFLTTLLVMIGVKEVLHEESGERKRHYKAKEVLSYIVTHPMLLLMMVISLMIQMGLFSVQPLLSLYVAELIHSPGNMAFLAGIAFSVTGLGNLFSTRRWGKFGDRVGHEKVILLLLVLAGLLFIPQAFVNAFWQLLVLRFLFGLAVGGLIPCTTAFIRQVVPSSMQGEVLGYNQSFRFLGNVLGPVSGGILAGYLGMSSVFLISGLLFLVTASMLKVMGSHVRRREMLEKEGR
ncbi:MFS transporter [Shouchella lonarensis]|uniref:Predicted arabinose efflux permease, MFS family n=1 Tax=Shouchella lonarensis TaxID=1464122 RepID=A0A1G6HEZ8_9BACI|nr:MFS transporter [Shouchella lonarensis]SDB92791.1 Predicted arabinose efflux permease, MFS family [Shouchella lonarensis]